MSNTIQQITDAITSWQTEDEKFAKGNNTAGTRARKALQEIGKLVKERRKEIAEERNTRKVAKVTKEQKVIKEVRVRKDSKN